MYILFNSVLLTLLFRLKISEAQDGMDLKDLNKKMQNKKTDFRNMEDNLPHKNGYSYIYIVFPS